jgi:hypothetical protein
MSLIVHTSTGDLCEKVIDDGVEHRKSILHSAR